MKTKVFPDKKKAPSTRRTVRFIRPFAGASLREGAGLGDQFLGHVERCAVLIHLIDGTTGTPVKDYRTIIGELMAYGGGLAEKPRITVLNKIDAMTPRARDFALRKLEEVRGGPVMAMSGVTGEGVTEVLRAARAQIEGTRAAERGGDAQVQPWQP